MFQLNAINQSKEKLSLGNTFVNWFEKFDLLHVYSRGSSLNDMNGNLNRIYYPEMNLEQTNKEGDKCLFSTSNLKNKTLFTKLLRLYYNSIINLYKTKCT